MNKAERLARDLVLAWCKHSKIVPISLRHIHARCYVVAKVAPQCLLVARPWIDSEPQCQDFDRKHGFATVRAFDVSLNAGDWCVTAYVSTGSSGYEVAVKVC